MIVKTNSDPGIEDDADEAPDPVLPAASTLFAFGISQFTTLPWSFEEDIAGYERAGAQAIEVCEVKIDPARVAEQMALPAQHGMEVTSIQPSVRTLFPSRSQPVPKPTDERVAHYRRSIEMLAPHAENAVFICNTGAPPAGNVQHVIDTAKIQYRELASIAAANGVRMAFEPISPTAMNTESAVWTVEQAMDIVDAVGMPNFGICLDIWNIWLNPHLHDSILACGDRIFAVHVSDWRPPQSFEDRLVPGAGAIPLPAFFQSLSGAGYTGACSVELFSRDVPDSYWNGDIDQMLLECREGMERAWREAELAAAF